MKVLVTGGTGFIGSTLCRHLLRQGCKVRASSRSKSRRALPAEAELVQIPSMDENTDWTAALDGVDAVVHLAGRAHVMRESHPDPLAIFRRVNSCGTERLARGAANAGVRRFVYLSSIKVNGEQTNGQPFTESDLPCPDDPYGISKWEAEQALWKHAAGTSMEVVILRPPMVYGPDAPGNFLRLMKLVQHRIPLPLASVRNQRSFVYVENLCDVIRVCLESPAAVRQVFLISDGEDVSTPDLMRILSETLRCRPRLVPFPPAVLNVAAALAGFSQEAARLLGSLRVDSSKIRQALQWTPPYTLRQGLRATAHAYMAAVGSAQRRAITCAAPPHD